MDTLLLPLPEDRFGVVEAQHLLNRAGFGGTPAQARALQGAGVAKAVDLLVDYHLLSQEDLPTLEADPDILRPPTQEERILYAKARRDKDQALLDEFRAQRLRRENQDRGQMRNLERTWINRMIQTPRPLEEKLILLWHGHFAAAHRTVRDSYLMCRQHQFFREHAAGSFADLARGIVRDPAMLGFLDNHTSRKGKPNENLARELMELFTLGQGNYSESDIKEGARTLTGYSFQDNDFFFDRKRHDAGSKKILGQIGPLDGDGFVGLLLRHPACPRFVAYKLYRHFVRDVPDPQALSAPAAAVVEELAAVLRDNDYQLRPVLKRLFASRHFYDSSNIGAMIKSPVQLLVGTMRMLETPLRAMGVLTAALHRMGQELFNPPSVAGWDGGRAWINSSTLFARQNLCVYLLTGRLPTDGGRKNADSSYDPRKLLVDTAEQDPDRIAEWFLATLVPGPVPTRCREALRAWRLERGGQMDRHALVEMLVIITAMPEYQLC